MAWTRRVTGFFFYIPGSLHVRNPPTIVFNVNNRISRTLSGIYKIQLFMFLSIIPPPHHHFTPHHRLSAAFIHLHLDIPWVS